MDCCEGEEDGEDDTYHALSSEVKLYKDIVSPGEIVDWMSSVKSTTFCVASVGSMLVAEAAFGE